MQDAKIKDRVQTGTQQVQQQVQQLSTLTLVSPICQSSELLDWWAVT